MWTRSEVSQCGCAFASVTRPWVAQRVWPMPVEPLQVPVRLGDRVAQVLEVADGVDAADRRRSRRAKARRVVAAVLEALQALEQKIAALARPDVSNDPAHDAIQPKLCLDESSPVDCNDLLALLLARRLDHHCARAARCRTNAPAPARAPRAPSDSRSTAAQTVVGALERAAIGARARSRAAGAASPSRGARRGRAPASASSASSAAAVPSPAGTKPVSMMWPDCSPPSAQPRAQQLGEHVAVADVRGGHLDPVRRAIARWKP